MWMIPQSRLKKLGRLHQRLSKLHIILVRSCSSLLSRETTFSKSISIFIILIFNFSSITSFPPIQTTTDRQTDHNHVELTKINQFLPNFQTANSLFLLIQIEDNTKTKSSYRHLVSWRIMWTHCHSFNEYCYRLKKWRCTHRPVYRSIFWYWLYYFPLQWLGLSEQTM